MQSVVTAKVRLPYDGRLIRTMETYSKAVQFCVDFAWEMGLDGRIELHNEVYYRLKRIYGLQAQLCANAIKQATEIIKKAETKPTVKRRMSIRYNFPRCASVKGWETLSLSTMEGRIKLPIKVPECYRQYLDWEIRESNLIYKKGKLFFCFTFAKEVNFATFRDNAMVVGVDLGVNNLAVTSNGGFYNSIKHLQISHERLVAQLESKGTRAAKRKLKKMSGSWERFQIWVNHNISKEIVSGMQSGDVVVMEDLTHIRRTASYNKWVHKWAFAQLQGFIGYKAIKKGCRVAYGNPAFTSREDNLCHSLDTTRHRGFLKCNNCGFSLSADLNAARNIAQRYMRNMCGANVNWPEGLRKPDLACHEAIAVSDSLPN